MAAGRGWGGASRAGSNHPALACTSAAPPYPRRGCLWRTYVAVFSCGSRFHLQQGGSALGLPLL
jgi:hypothetical protein